MKTCISSTQSRKNLCCGCVLLLPPWAALVLFPKWFLQLMKLIGLSPGLLAPLAVTAIPWIMVWYYLHSSTNNLILSWMHPWFTAATAMWTSAYINLLFTFPSLLTYIHLPRLSQWMCPRRLQHWTKSFFHPPFSSSFTSFHIFSSHSLWPRYSFYLIPVKDLPHLLTCLSVWSLPVYPLCCIVAIPNCHMFSYLPLSTP